MIPKCRPVTFDLQKAIDAAMEYSRVNPVKVDILQSEHETTVCTDPHGRRIAELERQVADLQAWKRSMQDDGR